MLFDEPPAFFVAVARRMQSVYNAGMKVLCRLFPLLCLFTLLTGCRQAAAEPAERALFAMDTYIEMAAYGPEAEAALADCAAEIGNLEALFSATLPGSDISRINAAGGAEVTVSGETAGLLAAARALSLETDGAFDPTVYPLMRLWGFGDDPAVPEPDDIRALLPLVDAVQLALDGEHVSLPPHMGIDLGGIAKGYTTDRLCALLEAHGVACAKLTLGGNVYVLGVKPDGGDWRIGVRDPANGDGIVGVVQTHDCAIITSGSYQRYFETDGMRFHHILDPDTGYPADDGLVSVTIIAGSGTRADALSTALFVMGEADAIAYWRAHGQGADGFACVLVATDGRVLYSEGAPFTPSSGIQAEMIPLQAP